MFEQVDENLDYCAEYLDENKKRGQSVTLILGSRASALFSCSSFYEKMSFYSSPTFPRKKRMDQFGECYDILTKKGEFTVKEIDRILCNEIDRILCNDLSTMKVYTTNLYLAALLMQGLFTIVISTRLDDFVERALSDLDMVSPDNYTIYDGYNPQSYHEAEAKEQSFTLVNVFGSLKNRGYRVQRQGYFAERPELSNFIRTHTGKNVFLLGYDPFWDKELGELLPQSGGRVWCINEDEQIRDNRAIQRLDESRDLFYYLQPNGSYERFIECLYWRCSGKVPVHYLTQNYIFRQQVALQRKFFSLEEALARLNQSQQSKV